MDKFVGSISMYTSELLNAHCSQSPVPWVPEATRLLNPAGQTSVRSEAHFGPHAGFTGLWPAGFSKRVASGTQGKSPGIASQPLANVVPQGDDS